MKNMGEMDGIETAQFFNYHVKWAHYMLDECLVKKSKPMKVFHDFYRWHDKLYLKVAGHILTRVEELDLKNIILLLYNGNITNLKRHSNIRVMHQVMLKGVPMLIRDKDHCGENFEAISLRYYEIGLKYCHGQGQKNVLADVFRANGIDIFEL